MFTKPRGSTPSVRKVKNPNKKSKKTEAQHFLSNLESLKQLRNLIKQREIEKSMTNNKLEWRYKGLENYMVTYKMPSSKY
jgi:hypothetical protein